MTALLAAQAAGNLYLPALNADLTNKGVVSGDTGYVWRTGGLMLAVVLGVGLLSVATTWGTSRVAMGAGTRMRAALFRRVQAFSTAEVGRFGIPSLITRNINDVQQITAFLQAALAPLVMAVLMCAGAVVMAVRESAALSLLLVVAVPVLALVIGGLLLVLVPMARTMQDRVDRINHVLREQITGVRVTRAFLRTGTEQQRFHRASADLTAISLRTFRIYAAIMPVVMVVANLSSVGVIWFGGHLVSRGSTPIGNLTAFLVYVLQVLVYAVIAVSVIALAPRAVASAERVDQVLRTDPVIADPADAVTPAEATGAVEFRHVDFGYPGGERPVLTDVTFTLRPGRTTGIVGSTGSGKTTLLQLILRAFDVTGGEVLVDGVDVRRQSADRLRGPIGLVPQAGFLFGGTVASNLRFAAPDATDEQVWRALTTAQARDFVAAMPGGLDAPIDQGGTNISGGQRQRLSIARALVRPSRLYLFDDCFSALDVATDARLRAALRDATREATVVIVAQRVSTIMHADQIIVLDAGRVVGVGTHEHLLDQCVTYQEIVASQLGEEAA
ncbi:ABC transporter ATP-binding protein [Streptomyces sp. SN-593]